MKKSARSAPSDSCVVENVARVLAEEPRLEAVAFEAKSRKLAMATLGDDPGERLARRVAEAVHTSPPVRAARWPTPPATARSAARPSTRAPGRQGPRGGQAGARQHAHRKTDLLDGHPFLALAERALAEVRPARRLELLPAAGTTTTTITATAWPRPRARRGRMENPRAPGGRLPAGGRGRAGGGTVRRAGLADAGAAGWRPTCSARGRRRRKRWEKVRAGALDVHFLMLSVAHRRGGGRRVARGRAAAVSLQRVGGDGALRRRAAPSARSARCCAARRKTATVLDDAGAEMRAARRATCAPA